MSIGLKLGPGQNRPVPVTWPAALARNCLLLVLLMAATANLSAAPGGGGTVLHLELMGDLSQGSLLRAASIALPGPTGALVRRVWWSGHPGMTLPSGKMMLTGGLPVSVGIEMPLRVDVPTSRLELSRARSQRRALGLLGLQQMESMKRHLFRETGRRRRR